MENPYSTSGAKTYLQLGWTVHTKLGLGYDVVHRNLRDCALEQIEDNEDVQDYTDLWTVKEPFTFKPNMHTITTSEELKTRIKADVSATVPIEGAAIEASSSYLRSVKTSDTSLLQVIEEIIEALPVHTKDAKLKFTAEASRLMEEDQKRFTDKYGEYFVYGHLSRARFTGICNIKTSSKELRDEIKNTLTAEAGDVGRISASLETFNSHGKESCSIDMSLEIDKMKAHDAESRPHFEIGKVVKAFDDFQRNFEVTPYVALLKHYSTVPGSHFPSPQNTFIALGPKLSKAYQSLYLAQISLSHSPMVQAASCSEQITKACDTIKDLEVNDEKAVASMDKSVQDCLDEVERWRLRFDLQSDAKKLANKSMKYRPQCLTSGNIQTDVHVSNSWISSGDKREWSSGKLGAAGDVKYDCISSDVKHRSEHFQREWLPVRQYQSYELGDSQDSVIGYRIVNVLNNNNNGWCKLHHGQIRDDSSVKVEFCAESFRDANWTLDVWTVDRIKYEVQEV